MKNDNTAATAAPITLDPISEVVINVADVARSVKWYQTSFHCEVLTQDLRRAVLRFRNISLVLVLPSSEPRNLTFQRTDAHTLGELRPGGDGKRSTYLADPTGNVVRILESEEKAIE